MKVIIIIIVIIESPVLKRPMVESDKPSVRTKTPPLSDPPTT